MSWDGKDRRKEDREDGSDKAHDMLIRIDTNLSNFMSRFEAHVTYDEKNFDNIYAMISKLNRLVYIGLGIVLAIEFASKFIGHG